MGESGYINWDMVAENPSCVPTDLGQTYVYAFWLVDLGQAGRDDGVRIFKGDGPSHPDWFLHAETADELLLGVCPPGVLVSNNYSSVFEHKGGRFILKPTVGAVLLGTKNVVFTSPDRSDYWSCGYWHVNRRGKRILKDLTTLYQRQVHIVTFLDMRPMNESTPGAVVGQATVTSAPG